MINYIILLLLLALCFKAIVAMVIYPMMFLSVVGKRQKAGAVKMVLCFPLRVVEHFLRFGGADSSCSKSPRFLLATLGSGCIRDWA